ncbi:hypothetical protein COY87_01190 [Candidatus Roizmanbacteria bacterium CG_4_10_14_0_8_um_filter_33_9]|uniref:Uncharacterized protein n=1 Tax=Candidatus Roizmanbacteria bacterium CG_4_10_14_0_8_um_filter_33_9 TaxID=1974826 RepID=A0A2M7QK56_9BACT|nr:MAG: hypothetical protein COY87_01190 [Candidatus Roizmanbacteria bacterium CG_4_10_14_0_8_um_filter_33_9]
MVYALNLADPTVNPTARIGTISTLVNVIVPLLISFGGFIFLIMLLVGAFTYLTSAGQQEQLKKAQQTLSFAVLGLVIIICSFIIVKIIGMILKVDIPI